MLIPSVEMTQRSAKLLTMDKIAVIDFGGQYAHLIASRIRRGGVLAEIVLPEEATTTSLKNYKGIILSGGPASTLAADAPTVDPAIFALKKPVLAICYGHQLAMRLLGGKVKKGKVPEYGPAKLKVTAKSKLFSNLPKSSTAWMSHWDEVAALPTGFEVVASTSSCQYAAVANEQRQIWSVQFHPEVVHTEIGSKLLENFVKLTKAKKSWTMDAFLKAEITRLKKQVGDRKVFLLVSGGVDSTVAFALLEKALGKQRVYGLTVDHGLMRADEADWVKTKLSKAGFDNLHVAHESGHFLAALKNAVEPEDKRGIIGRVFLAVQRKALKRLRFNPRQWLLGQGTIYPDTIESGGTKNADKIKTHHNRVPEIEAMIAKGLVIEPLADLYKDEVREVGRKLKLPAELIERHPFPGPGLGVRILCATAEDKLKTALKIETEIKRKWKLPAKVLPIKSVGVQGDARTYRHPVAIFTSSRDWEKLDKAATEIIAKFPEINRVVLCLNSSKAPRSFKVHPGKLTTDRIELLQTADMLVTQTLHAKRLYAKVWQMPVVLAPVSASGEAESIILRPVESQEAMTAAFSRLPPTAVNELAKKIAKDQRIEYVFYDLTNKPPGTIEWE
jgi:GMP synthase (glutamine-hydrolysing)